MPKVVAYVLLFLDGVAESPDQFFEWGDAVDATMTEVIATQDAVMLGRRSYDEWAAFWPGSEIEPFSTFINGVKKYVATSNAARGLGQRDRDHRRPGGDIGVHASISVTQALLDAKVADELGLVIAPRIVGTGKRLLEGLPPIQLQPIRSDRSPSGHLLAVYRVTR